ncbi:synaptic vesicle glycoprotein 2B [Drosophila rhopaloa]|uniref:Major facilitator superfamily (MFS) profile domain-containing protein n=1 Tax=Drosophila rhopaloa TaxID=1041015 RepID=A0ABM5I4I5_DRORH|nr:synaptic vesicle glycoprotein 2B [Drosophila rhopaloa]
MSEKNIEKVDSEKSKELENDNDADGNSDSTAEAAATPAEEGPATFDKAIEGAGFGLFNLMLLIVSIPAQSAAIFESSSMSYILPVAECDLRLTLEDKGVLNAMAYAGMIFSAIAWGYLADTKGRKKILYWGYLLDAVCVFGSALSQNFIMLVIFKFLGGLVVNGPAAVLFTYLTEMHGPKHRSSVLMIVGMVTSTATVTLPLLAWGIFPRDWEFQIWGLVIHSWQIFLFVLGIPSLVSGLIFCGMPESPRFLMSQGRNEEALQAFRNMYHVNTRKSKDTYPVKALIQEAPDRKAERDEAIYTIEEKSGEDSTKRQSRTLAESLRSGLQQMKPLARKPLLGLALCCYVMQFGIFLGMNTIRLWLPQLFASMAEYEALHVEDGEAASMCTILEFSVNQTAKTALNYADACLVPKEISMDMYLNNIIVSATGFVGYFFAGGIIRTLGPKRMMTYGLFLSGTFGLILYFSVSSLMTLIVSATFLTITGIAVSSLLGAVVMLFPTQLRTVVVSIAMMCGRLGALSGNLLFPVFVQIGCLPPFIMVSSVLILSGILSIFLPNPAKASFS